MNRTDAGSASQALSILIRSRRSVRDFLPDPIPPSVLEAVLADANWAPSWSNTQPYRVAVATGAVRDRIAAQPCDNFDHGMAAQNGGAWAKLKFEFLVPRPRCSCSRTRACRNSRCWTLASGCKR